MVLGRARQVLYFGDVTWSCGAEGEAQGCVLINAAPLVLQGVAQESSKYESCFWRAAPQKHLDVIKKASYIFKIAGLESIRTIPETKPTAVNT